MLKQKLTEEEFDIVKRIIDSTDKEYINKTIENLNEKYNVQLPSYLFGRGLPIGNVSSQFLSVFYLYELDHKIIHDLKIKYYIRYLDDFLLIHPDKKYLQKILEEVTCILNQKYHLKINSKKTEIKSSKEWNEFLGCRFKVINRKTIFTLRNSSIKRMKKRVTQIKYLYKKGKITEKTVFSSLKTFEKSFKYGSYLKRKRIINLFYEK